MRKLKITILTDKSSWMNEYNIELQKKLARLGHLVKIISSTKNLTKGDICFFLSCFEIIKSSQLKLHQYNIVVHQSFLPRGKGWSPMSWQILEGKKTIPITLFEATESVDAGDIYFRDKIVLTGNELADEWRKLSSQKTIEMCLKFIKQHPNNKKRKQKGKVSFYPKRYPQDNELDVNKTIKDQFNLLRIVDNEQYPAFFMMNKSKYILKIKKAM